MRPYPRWMGFAVGIAGILMYPSVAFVGFYWDAMPIVAAAPELERSLSIAVAGLEGKHLACIRGVAPSGGVTPTEVEDLHVPVCRANSRLGEGRTDAVYAMLKREIGVARGISELVTAANAVGEHLGAYHPFEEFCQMPSDLLGRAEDIEASRTPEEIVALEREGEPKLREHVAKLEEFRRMFTRARATHEARKVWFHALAWGLILVEVVGLNSAVAIIRAVRRQREGGK